MHTWWGLSLLIALCWGSAPSHAETIYLKNGRTIVGKVLMREGSTVFLDVDGVSQAYRGEEIDRIEKAPPAAPATHDEVPAPGGAAAPSSAPAPSPAVQAVPPPLQQGPPALSVDDEALLTELIRLSGLAGQLAVIPAQSEVVLKAHEGKLPPDVYAMVRQLLREAYQPDALLRSCRAFLQAQFDHDQVTAVIQQARSPLSQKMAQLERAASAPSAAAAGQAFAAHLPQQQPSPRRLALVQRVFVARHDEDFEVQVGIVAAQTTATTVAAARGVAPPEPAHVEQVVRQQFASSRGPQQAEAQTADLFAYRSVSDEELTQYVASLESPPGQWFISVFQHAVLHAMADAKDQVVRRSLDLMKAQHPTATSPSPRPSTN